MKIQGLSSPRKGTVLLTSGLPGCKAMSISPGAPKQKMFFPERKRFLHIDWKTFADRHNLTNLMPII